MIDLHFRVNGSNIPADHAYELHAAISRIIPEAHHDDSLAILSINGAHGPNRKLMLSNRSRLMIRIPHESIPRYLPLAGKRLSLSGSPIRLGVPLIKALVPSNSLYSRLVTIKGYTQPDAFLVAVRKALDELVVTAEPHLIEQQEIRQLNERKPNGTHSPFLRRTVKVRENIIVGFAVLLQGLNTNDSILVQERGIGGRRHFGCGIFMPALPKLVYHG